MMEGKTACELDILLAPAENDRRESAMLMLVINAASAQIGPIEVRSCESVSEWIVSAN